MVEGRAPRASPVDWCRQGAALCRRVYGPVMPRLLESVQALHPDLATWMVEQGYGRVLSRPGLGARERELVTVAVLAQSGWERQLVSHLLGAARLGAEPRSIRRAAALGARSGSLKRSCSVRGGPRSARRGEHATRPRARLTVLQTGP
ncbi:MAG TPA: carboxymuconolactone decarboxylase family protein [Candidatus Limnocylindria bacterium]|nr:carboxymuconolactone decarboxylase family protein [Candidatus Limnocylindria bacterium]